MALQSLIFDTRKDFKKSFLLNTTVQKHHGHVWLATKESKRILLVGTHHYLTNEDILSSFTHRFLKKRCKNPTIVWQECIYDCDETMDAMIAKHFPKSHHCALDDEWDDFLVNFINFILEFFFCQDASLTQCDEELKEFIFGNTFLERFASENVFLIDQLVRYRNQKWLKKIGRENNELIIVGNDHLYHQGGLLHLLTTHRWKIKHCSSIDTFITTSNG